jgi:hypothetical protein
LQEQIDSLKAILVSTPSTPALVSPEDAVIVVDGGPSQE